MIEKLDMTTPDFTNENIAQIAALFPNCVTETKDEKGNVKKAIDFDLLKQELSENIVDGTKERYSLNWPGKKEALVTANKPINKTLRPDVEDSVNFDTTQNLYIEGDNLEALKLLQESYLNKIKMIYIDPPYNTGNDFVYKDNFTIDKDEELEASGQISEEGRLVANLESNGRYHSDWLSMMYPRLKLARNLLKEDGVIFISIDDNEAHNLKKVCDEIYGENNFITELIWSAGKKNDSRYVSVSHEYILIYVKNIEFIKSKNIIWRQRKEGLDSIYAQYEKLKKEFGNNYSKIEEALKVWFKNLPESDPAKKNKHYSSVDSKGIYFPDNISSQSGASRPRYEIPHPITKLPVAVPSRGWGFTLDTLNKLIAEDKVDFGKDHTTVPKLKAYLKDRETEVPYSVFYMDGRASTKRLMSLFGKKIFENPKDELVLSKIINFATEKDSIVLDFFSGSASTAHSIIHLNKEDNGNRKFICVQIPELTDEKSEAYKAGYKTICEIGKERIRRAGKKIVEESGKSDLDIGFRVLKIDSSNMENVYYSPDEITQESLFDTTVDNIKDDRNSLDLLFQVLLDSGVDLTLPIVKKDILGKEVYFVDDNVLVACFENTIDEALVTEIAKMDDILKVVFKDSSFESDDVRINTEQIFKQYSPDTDLKVI
ncbi:site-specific DNA-methyltransferase [Halarcobacter sp.]|uniref:site-specific DNA-methyltransferase n=1 Tax=Halarcobacter sp. TaxID=2321133 RepID=UPI0029F48856|nr:site-specific DNA-methyltransferase [Halarcobacter sp.]